MSLSVVTSNCITIFHNSIYDSSIGLIIHVVFYCETTLKYILQVYISLILLLLVCLCEQFLILTKNKAVSLKKEK